MLQNSEYSLDPLSVTTKANRHQCGGRSPGSPGPYSGPLLALIAPYTDLVETGVAV